MASGIRARMADDLEGRSLVIIMVQYYKTQLNIFQCASNSCSLYIILTSGVKEHSGLRGRKVEISKRFHAEILLKDLTLSHQIFTTF